MYVRNAMHAFFAPWPGLNGPLWTAAHATVAERYGMGRQAMESIYGCGTFWTTGFLALFMLPLVSLFKPVLPIALSLTRIITGYICIMVGMELLKNSTERGVAGIVAVMLYFLAERTALVKTAASTGGQTDSDARPE